MIVEEGSELAARLWASPAPGVASVLAYAEGRAALSAARRNGRLSASDVVRAADHFEHLFAELTTVGVDHELSRRAGGLADRLGLRGYDAVHLATATEIAGEVALITWDASLREAAIQFGLAVGGD